MFDVISIGSITKDVFLISKGFKIIKSRQFKTGYGECFAYGSKVELGDIAFDSGGGASNSAFTFKNLGLKPGIVSRLGDDLVGRELINEIKRKNIDTANIVIDKKEKTAYSTILLSLSGERTILVYRGASEDFSPADFNWSRLKCKWIYLSSVGGNFNVLKSIFHFAQKNKIKIAWNPGSKELKLGFKKLKPLINQAEILILNRAEAGVLSGRDGHIMQIKSFLNHLNIHYWAVSDGSLGAYVSDKKILYYAPALKVSVVNTTGAGDAFGSALVAGLIKRKSLKESFKLALLNSAGVITEMGAKHGLLEKMPDNIQLAKVKIREIK